MNWFAQVDEGARVVSESGIMDGCVKTAVRRRVAGHSQAISNALTLVTQFTRHRSTTLRFYKVQEHMHTYEHIVLVLAWPCRLLGAIGNIHKCLNMNWPVVFFFFLFPFCISCS